MDIRKDNSSFLTEPDFWKKYVFFLADNGIKGKTAHWNLHWNKYFIRFLKATPLHESSASDVKKFLLSLHDKANVAPWQIDQAKKALKIMLKNYLQLPWTLIMKSSKKSMPPIPGISNTGSYLNKYEYSQSTQAIDIEYRSLFKKMKNAVRLRHYSIRTEQTYCQRVRGFLHFTRKKPLTDLSSHDIRAYLNYLALERKVSAGTQNLALNAIVFLFANVLDREIGEIGDFTRAKHPVRLPVVLSKNEINRLLGALSGVQVLMAGLL